MFAAVFVTASAQVNVLTGNYGNDRANANLQETKLNPQNVVPGSFGKIGTFPVDGQVYAQPLYVSGLDIPRRGVRNVLLVFTQHNSVYAYDADRLQQPLLLWRVNLGPSVPTSLYGDDYTDIESEVGILSTGTIDLERGVVFVVSATLFDGAPAFQLHALDLATGAERLNGPVPITAQTTGTGAGSTDGGVLAFDPVWHLQRPGLLLANDVVYVTFGSHGDEGDWHGWVMTYGASDLRQVAAFSITPDGAGGSVWQAGRAPAADAGGNVYVMTGNGDYDGITNFSESFLRLSGANPQIADWYTPLTWEELSDADNDLSAGPALIPGTGLLLGGDKSGQLYLVDSSYMGHLAPLTGGNVQTIQAVHYSGIFDFAIWSRDDGAWVYLQEEEGNLMAYRVRNGVLEPTPIAVSASWAHSSYAGLAISADRSKDGTGILWETNGYLYDFAIDGLLHSYDASDLHELWNSEMTGGPDRLGNYTKFAVPTVANGRVYVPTAAGAVAVYGLK